MSTQLVKCPGCGSSDSAPIGKANSKHHKCNYCGGEFILDESGTKVERVVSVSKSKLPEARKKAALRFFTILGEVLLILILIAILVVGCRAFLNEMTKEDYYSASVNTIGQYEVPPLTCPSSEPVELDFGINQQPPFLQVWPGISGKDRWVISPENAKTIANYQGEYFSSYFYLWEHCVNSKNLPEVYLYNFSPPQDGMQVVFKPPR